MVPQNTNICTSRKSNWSRTPYYAPKKLPLPLTPASYPTSQSYKKSKSPEPHFPVGFPGNHSKMQVYNVFSFGAVGNGVKDDTQAFKNTWNAGCQDQISTSSASPPPYSPVGFPENHYKMQIYNVLSFGAVGNGVKDDTQPFKNTWNAACQAQISTSSTVFLVPHKFSFMIQPIIFTGPCKSRLVFQCLRMDRNNGPKTLINKQDWLLFKGVHGMLMQGNGLINGRGEKWWDLPCKPHKIIRFSKGSDLSVQGLRLENSPKVHLRFDSCQHVNVERISIKAPRVTVLTRMGIHIENTTNIKIHRSTISTVSLGKGNSKACVTNITVSDSTIKNSDNGVRIKTWQGGGSGSVSELTFKDIHMDIVLNPIIIDQFYCLSKKCPNQTSALMINSVHFSNIKGTYDSRKPPMHLACSDSMLCKNLTLPGIDLVPAQGGAYLDPFCWKAFGPKDTFSTRQVPCLTEPGFYLLKRLLKNSKKLKELFP
ncbi:hypothetical protein ACE6H2_022048 [Prunus campanulata]